MKSASLTKEPKAQVDKGDIALTVQEAGARGGHSTFTRYGRRFYVTIGRQGGRQTATLYRGLLKQFGKHGGRPRRPSFEENVGKERPESKGGCAVGPWVLPPAR